MHSILEGRKQGASGRRGPDGVLPRSSRCVVRHMDCLDHRPWTYVCFHDRSPLCKLEWFRSVHDASKILGARPDCRQSIKQVDLATMTYDAAKHTFRHGYSNQKLKLRGFENAGDDTSHEHAAAAMAAMTSWREQEEGATHAFVLRHARAAAEKPEALPQQDATDTAVSTTTGTDDPVCDVNQSTQGGALAPLRGWLVAGRAVQSFDINGHVMPS